MVLNEQPKKKLKVTGTRFGAVLGLNKWATPFQMWCEITRVAKKPFIGNDATNAGIMIEVKQQRWAKKNLSPTIMSPNEYYGEDVDGTKFDFFDNDEKYGGKWDALDIRHGKPVNVIEFKTTKRPDDWLEQPPLYYQAQVLLYAHLLGVEDCTIVCSYVDESDYIDPTMYIVDDSNTRIWKLNTKTTLLPFEGDMYTIEELVTFVDLWYYNHIEKGISPEYDKVRDKEYLDLMQTTFLEMKYDIGELIKQRKEFQKAYESLLEVSGVAKLKADIDAIDEKIKESLSEQLTNEKKKIVCAEASVNRIDRTVVDTQALKDAGLFQEYSKTTTSITYKFKKEKEDN